MLPEACSWRGLTQRSPMRFSGLVCLDITHLYDLRLEDTIEVTRTHFFFCWDLFCKRSASKKGNKLTKLLQIHTYGVIRSALYVSAAVVLSNYQAQYSCQSCCMCRYPMADTGSPS